MYSYSPVKKFLLRIMSNLYVLLQSLIRQRSSGHGGHGGLSMPSKNAKDKPAARTSVHFIYHKLNHANKSSNHSCRKGELIDRISVGIRDMHSVHIGISLTKSNICMIPLMSTIERRVLSAFKAMLCGRHARICLESKDTLGRP